MAGKVNTKFVVLLSVGLVAVFGLLAWAFVALAFKSGGDFERLGDEAMTEGDYYQAQRMYSRAVNKDTTNRVWLDKWVGALESWTPDTETAYQNAFFTQYMAAIRQIAEVQQTDVDAHARLLDLMYERLSLGFSRAQADQLADTTTGAVAYFDRAADTDGDWRRLLRYRGLALEMVAQTNGVLTDEQFALIGEDLRAAVEADPSDGESAAALMRWTQTSAVRGVRLDQDQAAAQGRVAALELGRAYLAENPEDPDVEMMVLAYTGEQAIHDARANVPEAERVAVLSEAFAGLASELDRIEAMMLEQGPDRVTVQMISRFQRMERVLDPASRIGRTRNVLDSFARARPEDAQLLTAAASAARLAGDLDEAVSRLEQVSALGTLPLSMDGLLRFEMQRSALVTRADVTLDLHERAGAEEAERRAELLKTAEDLRDRFKAQVSEDNLPMLLLEGRIALAKEDYTEALRLFRRFNDQTQNQNPDGLWYEARTGLILGQSGTVRTALNRMLELDPTNIRGLLVLADTELRLQETRRAADLYRRVLGLDSENSIALEGLRRIEATDNPENIEDPVLSVIAQARRVRQGWENTPADPAAASRMLEESLERLEYDPRLAAELASARVDLGDLEGARRLVGQSAARHPDNELLRNMTDALGSGDAVRARFRMIELSDRDEVEKQTAIASVAMNFGRAERLDAALAELSRLAPDNTRYIDLAFVRALDKNDLDTARELAQRAERLDIDRVRGLSYRARLASRAGDRAGAANLLRQAAALGTGDSSIHRLLAMELRELGRTDESVRAFEQAIRIRPDDVQSIFEYVVTLVRANRLDDALTQARQGQRYAMSFQPFVELWLQLEASAGGPEGLALAVRQRERMMEINPTDRTNRAALARMYMDQSRWSDARVLIDQLRAERDALDMVELNARWYAGQGRVGTEDGLVLAARAYEEYIGTLSDRRERTGAYLAQARFMASRGRNDLAVAAVDRAVEVEDPATMEGTKLRGDLMLTLGRPGLAAQAYQAVVDAGADTPEGSYRERLIEMYARLRDYDRAAAEMAKLPEARRTSLTATLQRAEIAAGRGDQAEARRILDDAVSRFAEEPFVYVKRAQLLAEQAGMERDALSDLEAALRLRPGDWRALRVRAALYFQMDRRSEALDDLRGVVRDNPSLDDVLFALINELLNDNRGGEAMQIARDAVERRSTDAAVMFELGRLFESREMWDRSGEMYGLAWRVRRSPGDGAKYVDMLLRRNPPDTNTANAVVTDLGGLIEGGLDANPGLLAAQALVLRARGREDFALQQMTKAFELSLASDGLMAGWGSNAARLYVGMNPDAEINYYRSLRARYTDAVAAAWLDLFIAQRRLAHGQGVEEAVSDLVRLASSDASPDAVRRLAMRSAGGHYYSSDRFEEAVAVWRQGLARNAEDWELNNNVAYTVSAKLGRHEEALPLAERAVESAPNLSEPYDTLANIYIALGKLDEAEQVLGQGMQLSRTARTAATASLTQGRLALARGDRAGARQGIENARSNLRAVPGREADVEREIEAFELQLGSEG